MRVFISYRRGDSSGHAGRVYDAVKARLGPGAEVFIDVDSINPGVDFVRSIESAVGSCDVLLAVIGPGWIGAADADGSRRLDDPGDFVRAELEVALGRGIRVVPVLVHGAQMPRSEDLPPALMELSRREALEMSDERWAYDADRLIRSAAAAIEQETGHGCWVELGRRRHCGSCGDLRVVGTRKWGSSPTPSIPSTTTTVSASKEVRFADPLTEPINNWKTTANPDAQPCAYRFTGTGYAIKSAPEFTCPALPEFESELDSLASSRIESDVRFLSEVSPQNGGLAFGLGCRTSGSGEGSRDYFISVFASGSFSLYQNSGTGIASGFTKLSSGSNDAFRSVVGQWRRLRLDCNEMADGSLRISAWLDGRTLVKDEVVEDPWPAASVELLATASMTSPVEVEFRNLSIDGVRLAAGPFGRARALRGCWAGGCEERQDLVTEVEVCEFGPGGWGWGAFEHHRSDVGQSVGMFVAAGEGLDGLLVDPVRILVQPRTRRGGTGHRNRPRR